MTNNMSDFDALQDVVVMRNRAALILEKLRHETEVSCEMGESPNDSTSAADCCSNDAVTASREFQRKFYDQHGFLVLKGFVDTKVIETMKDQMKYLVDSLWNAKFEDDGGDEDVTASDGTEAAVFRTDDKQEEAQGSNAYFLQSATKIHFFAEKDAMSEIREGRLKSKYRDNKIGALNKCGHGIHLRPTYAADMGWTNTTATTSQNNSSNVFHSYATSYSIRQLVVDTLGYINPVIPQSMYIFKQPFVGSEVTSHQDSTFLFTQPVQTCLGLWLALDNSTVENGCLWVRPGSQSEPLRRKFVRNPEYFGSEVKEKSEKPLMIFEQLVNEEDAAKAPWEGSLPKASWPPPCDGLFEVGFVPVECNAGDLVVFSGLLDHLSLPNYSCKQRHTFQLHLVEGSRRVQWAECNWLQYPDDQPFLSVSE